MKQIENADLRLQITVVSEENLLNMLPDMNGLMLNIIVFAQQVPL